MPHATAPAEGSIETVMNYHYEPAPGEKTKILYINTVGSKRMKNTPQVVQVTDLRSTDNHFTIDEHGFQFLNYPGPVGQKHESFENEDTVKEVILKEAEELIKKTTGASNVYALHHVIRREPTPAAEHIPADVPDDEVWKSNGTPAMHVHVDQSYRGADLMLPELKFEGADYFRSKAQTCRWAVINLWKPLKTVTRQPLAVCDAKTVREADLRPYPMKVRAEDSLDKKEREFEIWHVMASPEHKWYWPSDMKPDEALLIKCFDSKLEGVARRAPHSAFNLPDDQGPPRESIEIRCVVLWEDQPKE
ncbi:hypothetical protein CB0940_02129 [Cercospora beticola]|uniref:Hydroxylase/desaturase asaB n=1 Tax=Cercospora beticola TaxID=122368 RepID=A0A2G5I842_CERBT|nr:hypothetical protein CB0940_02129 [Cercospora beticola]PIB00978.1 hypothetical protein CB0940_02129 [Cercospora beticola]WPA97740.1 hypothetical protein RHO25_002351 [Cercospora beticola]